ncbi:unnamed protein product [Gongylonema pulchrum]|uniref:RING-type E3 ubiquitin transferase n=1 Tax=Gongylonema pulchrum TaxID=637853 RepID=A0A183DPQ7_9BILA|nr:unnamed protein product [Gongylonema pulchrum]
MYLTANLLVAPFMVGPEGIYWLDSAETRAQRAEVAASPFRGYRRGRAQLGAMSTYHEGQFTSDFTASWQKFACFHGKICCDFAVDPDLVVDLCGCTIIFCFAGVSCDGCMAQNFSGDRFKCLRCYDYDLCEHCYKEEQKKLSNEGPVSESAEIPESNDQHSHRHPMQCILTQHDFEIIYHGDPEKDYSRLRAVIFTCPVCGHIGFARENLIAHIVENHSEPSGFQACPICICTDFLRIGLGDYIPGHIMDIAGHMREQHMQNEPATVPPINSQSTGISNVDRLIRRSIVQHTLAARASNAAARAAGNASSASAAGSMRITANLSSDDSTLEAAINAQPGQRIDAAAFVLSENNAMRTDSVTEDPHTVQLRPDSEIASEGRAAFRTFQYPITAYLAPISDGEAQGNQEGSGDQAGQENSNENNDSILEQSRGIVRERNLGVGAWPLARDTRRGRGANNVGGDTASNLWEELPAVTGEQSPLPSYIEISSDEENELVTDALLAGQNEDVSESWFSNTARRYASTRPLAVDADQDANDVLALGTGMGRSHSGTALPVVEIDFSGVGNDSSLDETERSSRSTEPLDIVMERSGSETELSAVEFDYFSSESGSVAAETGRNGNRLEPFGIEVGRSRSGCSIQKSVMGGSARTRRSRGRNPKSPKYWTLFTALARPSGLPVLQIERARGLNSDSTAENVYDESSGVSNQSAAGESAVVPQLTLGDAAAGDHAAAGDAATSDRAVTGYTGADSSVLLPIRVGRPIRSIYAQWKRNQAQDLSRRSEEDEISDLWSDRITERILADLAVRHPPPSHSTIVSSSLRRETNPSVQDSQTFGRQADLTNVSSSVRRENGNVIAPPGIGSRHTQGLIRREDHTPPPSAHLPPNAQSSSRPAGARYNLAPAPPTSAGDQRNHKAVKLSGKENEERDDEYDKWIQHAFKPFDIESLIGGRYVASQRRYKFSQAKLPEQAILAWLKKEHELDLSTDLSDLKLDTEIIELLKQIPEFSNDGSFVMLIFYHCLKAHSPSDVSKN